MASQPDVMGRFKLEATLPIAFLDQVFATSSRDELLGVYAKWTQRIIGSENCNVSLLNTDGTLDLSIGAGPKGTTEHMTRPMRGSVVGAVLTRQASVYVPDLSILDLEPARIAVEQGFTSAYFAPVVSGTSRYGTLNAHFRLTSARPGLILTILEAMATCLASQMKLLEQMARMEDLIRTDPLTGTQNRRGFVEHAPKSWSAWTTLRTPFSMLTLDIDHFKDINDTYGHSVGDQVLIQMTERMGSAVRNGDRIYRLGGEEFGILLPDTSLSDGAAIAKRVHRVIRETPFRIGSLTLFVTVSVGVAEAEQTDRRVEDVLHRADLALYQGKQVGRDQVVLGADGEFETPDQTAA